MRRKQEASFPAPRPRVKAPEQDSSRQAFHEDSFADAYTPEGIDALLEDDEIDSLEHGFLQGYNAAI